MSSSTQAIVQNRFDCEKMQKLYNYLTEEVNSSGEVYFKSKFIADDLGMTPKEIGGAIPKLQDEVNDIEIEAWSYTGATTWRVAET